MDSYALLVECVRECLPSMIHFSGTVFATSDNVLFRCLTPEADGMFVMVEKVKRMRKMNSRHLG